MNKKFFIFLVFAVFSMAVLAAPVKGEDIKFLPNPLIINSLEEPLQDFINAYVSAVNKGDETAFRGLLSKGSAGCVEQEYVTSKISKKIPSDFLISVSDSVNIPPKNKAMMVDEATATLYLRYNNTTEVKYLVKEGEEYKQVTTCPNVQKKVDEMVMVHEATIDGKQYEMLSKDRMALTYNDDMLKFASDFLAAKLEDDVAGLLGMMHPSVLKCSKPDVVDSILLKELKSNRPKNPDRYWAVFVPGASPAQAKFFPVKATHQFAIRYQLENGWNTEYRHVAKFGNEYKVVSYCLIAEREKK